MSIQISNVEQEPEGLLNPWQEAGSRGLDIWFELPAAYAMPDGSGSEAGGGYDCSSLVEDGFATLDAEKEDHDEHETWLRQLLNCMRSR
jgi:hypothetical protein